MRWTTNGRRRPRRRRVDLEVFEHRARVVSTLQRQRHRQQSRRLVQHDQRVVLVDDRQIAIGAERRAGASRVPGRSIHSRTTSPAATPRGRVGQGHLAIVDEHLAALERRGGFRPRAGAIGRRRGTCRGAAPTSSAPTVHSGISHDTCVQFAMPLQPEQALFLRDNAIRSLKMRAAGHAARDRSHPARPGDYRPDDVGKSRHRAGLAHRRGRAPLHRGGDRPARSTSATPDGRRR